MAHFSDDRVLETTTTAGTGALALAGAVTGYKTFATARRPGGAAIGINDTCWYAAWGVDASGNATGEYEAGLGTYTAAAQLTRTTVLSSSNANAAVTFSAGTKYVAASALAARTLQLDHELTMALPRVTVASIAQASTDTLDIFARRVANRMTLRTIGPAGQACTVQDKISESKFEMYLPNNGATVGLNYGSARTSVGTVTHPTPTSAAPAVYSQQKRTRWANVVTTTNQLLGFRTANADKQWWRGNAAGLGGWNFHARFAIGLWPAATVRLFVGLTGAAAAVTNGDTVAADSVGLWHDTTEAATVLSFVTRDATTTTKAAITLAAALQAGQVFDFWMWAAPNGSNIGYRVVELNTGTTLVDTTTSTTLPTAATFLGPECSMSNGTANITVTTTAFEMMNMSIQSYA